MVTFKAVRKKKCQPLCVFFLAKQVHAVSAGKRKKKIAGLDFLLNVQTQTRVGIMRDEKWNCSAPL